MKKMKTKRYQEGMSVEGDYESSDDYKNLMGAAAREKADAEKSDTAAAPAKAAKRIVTKEELAKSGFDNLRDFLNAERGLKRRDTMRTPAPARSRMTGGKSGDADRDIGSSVRSSSYGEAARSARTLGDVMKEDLERSAAIRSGKEKTLGTRFQEGMRKFGRALATGQPQGGMKKGGMVGSASKRADGCAQRGKTRGKMV